MSVQVKNQAVQAPHLEQMSGAEQGRVFELHSGRLTLGRATENDVVITADGVSRVHALLVKSDGAWFIRDNNSKNGIYVNGQQVKESWLETGDVVQLGTFLFRFDAGVELGVPEEGNLPQVAGVGALDLNDPAGGLAMGGGSSGKKATRATNPRLFIYIGVIGLLGFYLVMGSSETPTEKSGEEESAAEGATDSSKLTRDFKTAEKPGLDLGTKSIVPLGMEDPLLKRAEQEMAKLDWTNKGLQEAEQFFRRGQREYLAKNYHRAIDSFQTSLSLYGGHLLAERYLRRAIYEVEIEAKSQMAIAIQYYESLQYARAIHHFNETIALMAHRPNEPIIQEAGRYIKQAELRLKAAELFP